MTGLMTLRFGVLRCGCNVSNATVRYRAGTRCPRVRYSHDGIRAEYNELVEGGKLQFNPYQSSAVDRLQKLQDTLTGYEPPVKHRSSWKWVCLVTFAVSNLKHHPQITAAPSRNQHATVAGVYIYGGVGEWPRSKE